MTAGHRRSPNQPALISQLPLGHFLHEPIEVLLGEVAAHSAQTPSYLFANFFLTEGMEFCKSGNGGDLFL